MIRILARICARAAYSFYKCAFFVVAHRKYRDRTMIGLELFCTNLLLVDKFVKVPGAVVECGVWRGGMSGAMADVLGPDRAYYLFDSYEGLPPPKEVDGASAMAWQQDVTSPNYLENCSTSLDLVKNTMARSKAKKVEFIVGWFEKTLPGRKLPEPIALLRLDGDWYESTMTCLEYLYPQVAPGGLIIIDDYFVWDGCARAIHDYLSRNELTVRLHERNKVAYFLKPK